MAARSYSRQAISAPLIRPVHQGSFVHETIDGVVSAGYGLAGSVHVPILGAWHRMLPSRAEIIAAQARRR